MAEDDQSLLELLAEYHITDRAVLRARDAARRGDRGGGAVLRRAVRRYFSSIERESRRLMSEIDRKLDDMYQRQYNLQCERGIIERRMQGARKALTAVGENAGEPQASLKFEH